MHNSNLKYFAQRRQRKVAPGMHHSVACIVSYAVCKACSGCTSMSCTIAVKPLPPFQPCRSSLQASVLMEDAS